MGTLKEKAAKALDTLEGSFEFQRFKDVYRKLHGQLFDQESRFLLKVPGVYESPMKDEYFYHKPNDKRTFEEVLKTVNDEKELQRARLLHRCEQVVQSLMIFEMKHFVAALKDYGVLSLVDKFYDDGVEELLNALKLVKRQKNGKYSYIGVLDEGIKATVLFPESLQVAETRKMAGDAAGGASRAPLQRFNCEKTKKPAAYMSINLPSSSKNGGTTTPTTGQPQLSARQPVAKKFKLPLPKKPANDRQLSKDGLKQSVDGQTMENNKENKKAAKTTGHGEEETEAIERPSGAQKETDATRIIAGDSSNPVEEEKIEKNAEKTTDGGKEAVSGEAKATGHPTATEEQAEMEEDTDLNRNNGKMDAAKEKLGDLNGNATKEVPMVPGEETAIEKETTSGEEGDGGQSKTTDGLEKTTGTNGTNTGEMTGAVEKTAATGRPDPTPGIFRVVPRKRRSRGKALKGPAVEVPVAPLVPKTEPIDEQETTFDENHEKNATEDEEEEYDFEDESAEEEETNENDGRLPGDNNNTGDGQREAIPHHLRNIAFKREPCDVITLSDDDEEELAPPARRRRVENEAHGPLQMAADAAPVFVPAPNNQPQGMPWEYQAFLFQLQRSMAAAAQQTNGPSSKHESFGRFLALTLDEKERSGKNVDQITKNIMAIFRE